MNDTQRPPDPITAAIEGAEVKAVQPQPVDMRQYNLTISSTGRPAIVIVPSDAGDGELAEVAGFVLTTALAEVRTVRAATPSGLVIARGPLPPKATG